MRGWAVVLSFFWIQVAFPISPVVGPTATMAKLAKLPLRFEMNQGQVDAETKFLCRTPGYTLYLRPGGALMSLPRSSLELRLVGGNPDPAIEGADLLPGVTNYFIGGDPARWRTNVPGYARVIERGVYRGVDLIFRENDGHVEYDFALAPGVDPRVVQIAVGGALDIHIDVGGDLILETESGPVIQRRPRVWQQQGSSRRTLHAGVELIGSRFTFKIDKYDPKLPIIIDPELLFATYLGGSQSELPGALAVGRTGDVYVAGSVQSDFPVTPGVVQASAKGNLDVFVARLNAAGSALVFATYVGGSDFDYPTAIKVDPEGNSYITGITGADATHVSTDFPTTPGALQPKSGGDTDAFVAKLNPTGTTLLYSTYLGGPGHDFASALAVDPQGNALVTGSRSLCSSSFPVTPGVFRATSGWCGGFVAKLNPMGTALLFSTDVGGTQIALDESGDVFLAGSIGDRFGGLSSFPTTPGAFRAVCRRGDYEESSDAFIAKLNPSASALLYATCLSAKVTALTVDPQGNAYVTGTTNSPDFTTTPGTFGPTGNKDCNADLDQGIVPAHADCEVFVAKLNVSGTALIYSTFVAASEPINGYSLISVDAAGNAYLAGNTYIFDQFPSSPGSFPANPRWFGFLMKVNANASAAIDSTRLPPGPSSLAIDAQGFVYLTGEIIGQQEFFATPGAFETSFSGGTFDAFVIKVRLRDTSVLPVFESRGVLSAASFLPGPIAPGELVTVYGTGFGPSSLTTLELTPNGGVDSLLGWTRLLFDGIPAPMVWVGQEQLTAVVPYEVAGRASSKVQIEYLGNKSASVELAVAQAAPAIFTADSSGAGQAAAINASTSTPGHIEINSPATPAVVGSIVTLYAAGAGETIPASIDGTVSGIPLPIPALPVQATIGGIKAEVLSATAAPNVVSGVVQVNVRVPDALFPGSAVAVTMIVGGVASQPGVTLAVK